MKNFKKLTSAVVSLIMVCTGMGGFTLWSNAYCDIIQLTLKSSDSLSFSVNDNKETTYTLNGKTEIYNGTVVLYGEIENGFTIEKGTQNISFFDVKINDSVVIKKGATANIELCGTNTVTAKVDKGFWDDTGKAGINVPEGATLNLFSVDNESILGSFGKLTVKGSDDGGECFGDGGAGIGGNNNENAGTINIKSGIITATGGKDGAGIGGGDDGNGGNINITGGTLNVIGGYCGAGIGNGNEGNGGNINITGGTINATGGLHGAGIGGGWNNNNGGNVTIIGGEIIATGGENGAGIGGGGYSTVGNITITNSSVLAKAGKESEPIGGGNAEFNSGKVTINGKKLDESIRKIYSDWKNIQVNPDGTIEKYT